MPQRVGTVLLEATFEPENGSATSVPVCFSSLSGCERTDLSGTPVYNDLVRLREGPRVWSRVSAEQVNNLTKGREWETSGSPKNGLLEVGGESLMAKPAKSD